MAHDSQLRDTSAEVEPVPLASPQVYLWAYLEVVMAKKDKPEKGGEERQILCMQTFGSNCNPNGSGHGTQHVCGVWYYPSKGHSHRCGVCGGS